MTVKVANALAVGTPIVNTAILASAEGANDTVSISINVGSAPNLVITGIASVTSIIPGGAIDYMIRYNNTGNMTAHNVIIRNNLPSETALVVGSITGGGSMADRAISWPIGDLVPGASGTVNFRVTVSPVCLEWPRDQQYSQHQQQRNAFCCF